MGSNDPEVIVDQVSNLSAAKETVLLLGLFVPPDWFFFSSENCGWFCSALKQSSHQVLQNSASKYLVLMMKIFKSSTESTISTSLIHSIASVGNCEQIHTSVLNLIFQQANVADVGSLSKWRSEICSRCWSAPQLFEESLSLGMTEISGWRSRLASLILNWCLILILIRRWWMNRFVGSFPPSRI